MAASTTPAFPPTPLPEPLRLPRGSVHGILALVLMGTFAYLLVQGVTSPQVLINAVIVCFAFYFGSHTPSPAPAAAGLRRPRIVRALLVLGFAGMTAWVFRTGLSPSSLPPAMVAQLVEIWEVLGGYLLGITLSWLFHRRVHESPVRRRVATFFRDLSALGALGLTIFACYSLVTGVAGTFSSYVEQALSLVITYYFGSRVIAR